MDRRRVWSTSAFHNLRSLTGDAAAPESGRSAYAHKRTLAALPAAGFARIYNGMWPFDRKQKPTIESVMEDAIELAAEQWEVSAATSRIPNNINLRDRITFFAADFQPTLMRRLPLMKKASEDIILLVIAEGVRRSGLESRRMIELQLGIVLPEEGQTP